MGRFKAKISNFNKWVSKNKKAINQVAFILILIFVVELIFAILKPEKPHVITSYLPVVVSNIAEDIIPTATPIPTPVDTTFKVYKKPTISKKDRYDVYILGDSMAHALGPRGGIFNEILSDTYEGTFFEIWNYSQGGKSIIELPAMLNEQYQADKDLLLPPALSGEPEIIIIESFGYNPPSQLGKVEGLRKQEEILTQVMTTLTNKYPNTMIVFLATIAPDKRTYGIRINKAAASERAAQAEERMEYIKNFINYANGHGIPLANAYDASLDATGDGDTKYINPDDSIHPSAEGQALMGRVLTQKIQENFSPQ